MKRELFKELAHVDQKFTGLDYHDLIRKNILKWINESILAFTSKQPRYVNTYACLSSFLNCQNVRMRKAQTLNESWEGGIRI